VVARAGPAEGEARVSLVGNIAATFQNRSPVPFSTRYDSREGVFSVLSGRSTSAQKMQRGMEQYGEVSTLFGIVSRLAESMGELPWHLYRTNTDGRRVYREVENRTEVVRHAAVTLLANPNPLMDTFEFVETLDQHFETAGEWWAVAEYGSIRSAGPLHLWPMRPDRVLIITDRDDVLTGYIYVGPDGETVPLRKQDVIHVRRPNPLDIYRGLGPVQALSIKLDANRLASEYNRNFFLNSAEPGGIIEIEDRLDDDEFRELETRWREQHRGVANAHRVAILEQGKWIDRKYTMKDMAFPELADLSRTDILEAFGYPKGMTGATEDVNKAVADANERMYGRYLVRPRACRFRSAWNNQLLPMFGSTGKGVEFDFDDPVPEDREADSKDRITKAQAFKLLTEAGVDGKDAAEVVGLPEMQWERPAPTTSGFGRPSQGDGSNDPNQPEAPPSPVREANNA
jgi:HK97 family phage portal protein